MSQLHTVQSPVFPVEKDVDVSTDEIPLIQTTNIQVFIQLAEPVVFIQGFNAQQIQQRPPSLLRGSLVVRILKPVKLKSISLNFRGYSRTDWPEGIPPKRQEFVELNDIVNHTWPFYHAHSNNRTDDSLHVHTNLNPRSPRNSFIHLNKEGESDNDDLLDEEDPILEESGASAFRALPSEHNSSHSIQGSSFLSLNNPKLRNAKTEPNWLEETPQPATKNIPADKANRSLSPISLLRRAASSVSTTGELNTTANQSNHSSASTKNRTSIFSDLLTSTFSNLSDSGHSMGDLPSASMGKSFSSTAMNKSNSINGNLSNTAHDTFTFQPGDYIYTFEQAIPSSYPESIKADFGFVDYNLVATIERYGAFKSNVVAKLPVTIVRTPSDSSIEETEPIAISRNWENHLHYDIMIASKDIILDAFLPIAFRFSPLDKVILHRIRIYLTETVEYYCKGKKVHRVEPTKKYLLAEHNGPALKPLQQGEKSTKAKYLGNLLIDETTGDVVNKDYEYQIFIPSVFANKQPLHPDTAFEKIKAAHWIKISLRLSKMTDGKRKHYEIVIDSPIHVLNKLCSHANTLLPCYDTYPMALHPDSSLLDDPQLNHKTNKPENNEGYHSHLSEPPAIHDSNIFFPKEVLLSPILSPEVHTESHQLCLENSLTGFVSTDNIPTIPKEVFNSPKLKANIYQPDSLQIELASAQAIPLSPINSPSLRYNEDYPSDMDPPEFDFDSDSLNSSKTDQSGLPVDPPSYSKVLSEEISSSERSSFDSVNKKSSSLSHNRVSILRSEQKLLPRSGSLLGGNSSNRPVNNSNPDDTDGDIASNFSFQSSSSILRTGNHSNSFSSNLWRGKPVGIPDNLPSTIRHDNSSYNDLNNIFGSDNETEDTEVDEASENEDDLNSNTSSMKNEEVDESDIGGISRLPLLDLTNSARDATSEVSFLNSADLSEEFLNDEIDNSFDIFNKFKKDQDAWSPIDDNSNPNENLSHHDYSFQVADTNRVLDDFKHTMHDSPLEGSRITSLDTVTTLKTPLEGAKPTALDTVEEPN